MVKEKEDSGEPSKDELLTKTINNRSTSYYLKKSHSQNNQTPAGLVVDCPFPFAHVTSGG